MQYIVSKSVVELIGRIWMPAVMCAQRKELSRYDLDNARDEVGNLTRDSVEHWISLNSGDFRSVQDFSASLEDKGQTIEIPWQNEESQWTYQDCMYPEEVE